jgi:crotonobetainyl-CoA:carnitine CoA-transferase CaiB-like acyl-CoA transferase
MRDYGASVILVEPPGGSAIRARAPFKDDGRARGVSLLFHHLNTGKASVTLDWTTASGQLLLRELTNDADVIVCGRSPAVDRAALRATNPRLITCLVSDFGEEGPYADWLGSEMIQQALAGTMLVTGHADRPPLYGFGHRTSYATGLSAYITILAAVYARPANQDHGQDVEATVMESAASMGQVFASQFFYNQTHFERGRYPNVVSLVRCRDGWLVVFAGLRWGAICRAFDAEELLEDERFAALPARQKNWRQALEILSEKASAMSADDIMTRGQQHKASISRVMTVADLWESPHLRGRGFWQQADTRCGALAVLGPAIRMSLTPRGAPVEAPSAGRDTAAVLNQAGLSTSDIEQLRDIGVV